MRARRAAAGPALVAWLFWVQAPSPLSWLIAGGAPQGRLSQAPAAARADRPRNSRGPRPRTDLKATWGWEVASFPVWTLAPLLGAVASWIQPQDPEVRQPLLRLVAAPRRRLANFAAAGAAAVAAARPAPVGAEGWAELVNANEPNHPPIRSESSDAEIALAKHLASVGAKCYSAFWDRESQEQREYFGVEATKLAPFVECSKENRRQNVVCREAGIKDYPTWEINGKRSVGSLKPETLAKLSGFTEFPKDAFKPRSIRVTNYLWAD